MDELTPEARLVEAANVIRRDHDGKLTGTVLDGEGFVAGLRSRKHSLEGKHCVVVGAGDAASAIAFALAKHGCGSLCILNRTHSKSEALAQRIRAAFPVADVTTVLPEAGRIDIAINATSLGMKVGDELPMTEKLIDRSHLIADCVVSPEKTALLDLAQHRDRKIHTGIPMLSAQVDLMLRFMGV